MISRPGATSQPFHPDIIWQHPEPSALVVWIALCDVSREMGPILLLPRTHTRMAHAVFQHTRDPRAAADAVGCAEGAGPLLRRGDALVMDSRVLHCGLANCSDRDRTLFYCTFRRAADRSSDAEWSQSSLRESLRDHHTLEALCQRLC